MSADGRAEESPQQGIQSIEVGAQVLRALEAGRGPMTLSEVARNCAMHPAKVHRYLVSLVRAGLADALRSTAGQISAELGYRPA
jgi:predicted ArsR family transcriptional regulator